MCIITDLNVEVLDTEHRDFQMLFCQMGSGGKPRRGFLLTDDIFMHTTIDLGGEGNLQISSNFTAITKGDRSQIFIMLANKDFSQLFLCANVGI